MPLRTGLSARVRLEVADGDTAIALRTGSVPVLATPRLIALCEEATCAVVAGNLGPGETTVAMRVQLDHLAPAAVGAVVHAEATLEKIEGRRLTFTATVSDDNGLIGAGKITRVVVDEARFLKRTS